LSRGLASEHAAPNSRRRMGLPNSAVSTQCTQLDESTSCGQRSLDHSFRVSRLRWRPVPGSIGGLHRHVPGSGASSSNGQHEQRQQEHGHSSAHCPAPRRIEPPDGAVFALCSCSLGWRDHSCPSKHAAGRRGASAPIPSFQASRRRLATPGCDQWAAQDRRCILCRRPYGSGRDYCEWHSGGTAGEDEVDFSPCGAGHQLGRTVRPVRVDHCLEPDPGCAVALGTPGSCTTKQVGAHPSAAVAAPECACARTEALRWLPRVHRFGSLRGQQPSSRLLLHRPRR
jgi:hypothetical protein